MDQGKTGRLVDGQWRDEWYETESTGGRFVRKESAFRDWVRADGSSSFALEAGRYHLYVSLACPWAHRTLIFRRLKRLEQVISVSVVHPNVNNGVYRCGFATSQERFLHDFVAAWDKVMNLDRFD